MILSKPKSISSLGFTVPFVALFVILLLLSPVIYFVFHSKLISSSNVKGISSSASDLASPESPRVLVSSKGGTWDLFGYLCNEKDPCVQVLSSGKRVLSVSGGIAQSQKVDLVYLESWKDYKYLKLYVRPGWGSTLRAFRARAEGGEIEVKSSEYEGNRYDVVVLPVLSVKDLQKVQISFTDF